MPIVKNVIDPNAAEKTRRSSRIVDKVDKSIAEKMKADEEREKRLNEERAKRDVCKLYCAIVNNINVNY